MKNNGVGSIQSQNHTVIGRSLSRFSYMGACALWPLEIGRTTHLSVLFYEQAALARTEQMVVIYCSLQQTV